MYFYYLQKARENKENFVNKKKYPLSLNTKDKDRFEIIIFQSGKEKENQ